MIIGTLRPEEAKVFDSQAGFHKFIVDDKPSVVYGSFEVFWDDADKTKWSGEPRNFDADGEPVKPGWYWWSCYPGCMPDSEPCGPFSTSAEARRDADENWDG